MSGANAGPIEILNLGARDHVPVQSAWYHKCSVLLANWQAMLEIVIPEQQCKCPFLEGAI